MYQVPVVMSWVAKATINNSLINSLIDKQHALSLSPKRPSDTHKTRGTPQVNAAKFTRNA